MLLEALKDFIKQWSLILDSLPWKVNDPSQHDNRHYRVSFCGAQYDQSGIFGLEEGFMKNIVETPRLQTNMLSTRLIKTCSICFIFCIISFWFPSLFLLFVAQVLDREPNHPWKHSWFLLQTVNKHNSHHLSRLLNTIFLYTDFFHHYELENLQNRWLAKLFTFFPPLNLLMQTVEYYRGNIWSLYVPGSRTHWKSGE